MARGHRRAAPLRVRTRSASDLRRQGRHGEHRPRDHGARSRSTERFCHRRRPCRARGRATARDDAGFRTLLGNAYFAAGRFASAEGAYRDSLRRSATSRRSCSSWRWSRSRRARTATRSSCSTRPRTCSTRPTSAWPGARRPAAAGDRCSNPPPAPTGADARVRQNLALAHALSGDWDMARDIAAQDLSADLVDARIQQWMAFAKPASASDQVAALIGVTPVAGDPGQPVRLALTRRTARVRIAAGRVARRAAAPVAAGRRAAPVAEPAGQAPRSSRIADAGRATLRSSSRRAASVARADARRRRRCRVAPVEQCRALYRRTRSPAPVAPSHGRVRSRPRRDPAGRRAPAVADCVRPRSPGKSQPSVVQLGAYSSPPAVAPPGTKLRRVMPRCAAIRR